MNLKRSELHDSLIESIISIDTTELSDDIDDRPISVVAEKQKVYIWFRLYLKEEDIDININSGDDVSVVWKDEKLSSKFICYGKTGMNRDFDHIVRYDSEDDRKILCLMVDLDIINESEEIPFIRTLFKAGRHYEYQLVKRDDLKFIIDNTNEVIKYYDINF